MLWQCLKAWITLQPWNAFHMINVMTYHAYWLDLHIRNIRFGLALPQETFEVYCPSCRLGHRTNLNMMEGDLQIDIMVRHQLARYSGLQHKGSLIGCYLGNMKSQRFAEHSCPFWCQNCTVSTLECIQKAVRAPKSLSYAPPKEYFGDLQGHE